MSLTGWLLFFLVIQVIHFLGTWKLYIKANRKAWEAAIPVYNAIVLMAIIKRPKWWVILLFIPIVNLLMFPIIWVETCRSFGYTSTKDTLLAIFTLGFYIFYVNYTTTNTYRDDRSIAPPPGAGEWISSISFAIIAATLVHTYFIQPYTIPTSSLEKTLLIGDYLFVSKFHYGARIPTTVVSAPMVHDTIPGLGIKSYLSNSKSSTPKEGVLNKLSLPYMRLPGLTEIKRNDIVVFSWPADSTNYMWGDRSGKFTYKPLDKRTNYVKRCVGTPGDSLEIKDGYIFINGKRTVLPESAKPQWYHIVDTDGQQFNQGALKRYNIRLSEAGIIDGKYAFNLTDAEAAAMRNNPIVKSVTKRIQPAGNFDKMIFPHHAKYPWSVDNFGPIYIPKKGETVALTSESIPFYEQIIRRYEDHDLTIFEDDIYINGKLATTYTFKQDYYWMMGDNRQNSLDARAWGYTPFDHVVGTPIMVWFSWDAQTNSVRWDRIFTTVSNGKSESYFWIGLLVLIVILYSVFKPRKKKV